ncbi:CpaF family protein [Actinoallomurus iriomotensis]|uniref:Protein kinase n=1 Tax=Actinoallomurus iriomotensis TaxID=478107 RepID=A0A9W6S044_9ACTN|nr:ATPase, T2SS/T4P/T4SS family [Actinoallomurus iriomotensis]GLY86021.1 protein kinase [Actinoallomurus iriomotensis]
MNGYGFIPRPVSQLRAAPSTPPPVTEATARRDGAVDGEELWAAVAQISRQLVDALSDGLDASHAQRLIEDAVRDWAQDQTTAGKPVPSVQQRAVLARLVFDRRYGLGALQPYLRRDDVENIVVNGHDQTWVTYTDGRKDPGPAVAGSDEELIEWVQLLARRGDTGREFSRANPLLDLALADGVRLAVVHWVSRRPCLALRIHRMINVTLDDLIEYGTVTEAVAQFLRAALRARRNLVVCGEVNTGKTTLVRALANELPPDERIITLESDFELFLDDPQLAHRHHDVVAWEARQANSEGAGQVRLQDLVPASLRMNPDRVIVGEARQGELAPMLEVMYSGARGSMCTLHVHRPAHIFNRVIQLGRRAGLGYTPQDLHLMFGLAEPLIVYLERDPGTNARFVSEVMEVGPPADGTEPTRNHIFVPGADGRATPIGGHISGDLLNELTAAGFNPALLEQAAGRWS